MDGYLAFSRRIKESIVSIFGWISSAMLLGLTLFALLEIVRRYIFNVVFEWGQDVIIVGMVSAVAIYFGVTQASRSHLVMAAFIQLFHARGLYKTVGILKIVVSAIVAVFCGSVGVTGWSTVSYALDRNLTTESLHLPLWPFYVILMFGFCLTAFIALLQMIEDIVSFARGEHLDGEIELTTDV